jgi:hypothetical protein
VVIYCQKKISGLGLTGSRETTPVVVVDGNVVRAILPKVRAWMVSTYEEIPMETHK